MISNNSDQKTVQKEAQHGLIAFDTVLQIIIKSQWKKAVRTGKKHFFIKQFQFKKLTPNRAKQVYDNISNRFYQKTKTKENWYENELRLFAWLLITYSYAISKELDYFEQQQWQLFSTIFCRKSISICKFEYLNLKKNHIDKSKKWTFQQKQLLNQILKQQWSYISQYTDRTKWNIISQQLFIRSQQKYFRTPRNCRERWYNQLNPNKQKNPWSNQEDYNLMKAIKENGRKWALISKTVFFGRRTQHTIKNRYNTLQLRYFKSINMPREEVQYQIQDIIEWLKTRLSDSKEPQQSQIKNQQVRQSQINLTVHENVKIKVQYFNEKQQQQKQYMIKTSPKIQYQQPMTLCPPSMYMNNWLDYYSSNYQFLDLGFGIKKQQFN